MRRFFSVMAAIMLLLTATEYASADTWSKYRIMIDPGHGGSDPGASGPSAPHEATLCLRAAKSLASKFDNLGAPYKLTRTADETLSLSARRSMSLSYDPYIFCSIHLNAYNGSANGTETWYYWSTGNSQPLANKVQATLIEQMGRVNRGVKQNGWTVITGSADIPAILTEGLFVDNYTEWSLIKNEGSDGFNRWVNGHLYGFYDHLKQFNANITNPRNGTGGTVTPTPDPTPDPEPEPTPIPSITIDPSSYSFRCESNGYDMTTVHVTAANLTSDLVVTSSSNLFIVTKTTLTRAGGWIDIKFLPSASGHFTGTLTVKSGATTATMAMTGIADAPILAFEEQWNFSERKGNLTAKGWDASKIRNIDYANGKLYMVYNQEDIKVINARTGDDLGNLNKVNVKGGTVRLADVKVCDGKVVASNIALAANGDALRVYYWENDKVNPGLLLETTDFGGANRIGDYIGWKGTFKSGELLFCSDDGSRTRIISYAITDGRCSKTPTVTYVTTNGTNRLATSYSTRVIPESNGYWIDGRDNLTTFVGLDGVQKFQINQIPVWGNAFKALSWKGSSFGLITTYDTNAPEYYQRGKMRVFNADDGWAYTRTLADYPSEGLGIGAQNINCTSGIATCITGETVEAWVMITSQGIAYYVNEGGTPPTHTVEPIESIMPYIKASAATVNVSAKPGVAARGSVTFSGARWTDHVALTLSGPDADRFTLSKPLLNRYSQMETVGITFTGTEIRDYRATLTASSDNCASVSVNLTASVTAPIDFNDRIVEMEERWIFSENSGFGSAQWFDRGQRPARDICLANWKIYALNSKPWDDTPYIATVYAYSGLQAGSLDMSGISGGECIAASVKSLGGIVILSNSARAAGVNSSSVSDPLRVYRWADDSSAPQLWLEDPVHGGIHVGEIMSVYGDMSRGKVMFSDGSKVLVYAVTNGAIASTPEVVALTRSGSPYSVGDIKGAATVNMMDDGSFWLTGKDSYPAHFTASGEFVEDFSASAVAGELQGTSATFFTLGDRRYMAAATYLNTTATFNRMTEGAIAVVDYTDGVDRAKTTAVYPKEGLGSTFNDSFQSAVVSELSSDGERLNLWVMVPRQGIAFYKFDASLPAPVAALEGDVNGDGSVNVGDVTSLIDIMLGNAEAVAAADIDCDGSVNIGDITSLIDLMLAD